MPKKTENENFKTDCQVSASLVLPYDLVSFMSLYRLLFDRLKKHTTAIPFLINLN